MRIFVRFLMACGLLFSSAVFAMTDEGTVTSVSSAVEAKKQVRKLKKKFRKFSKIIIADGGRSNSNLFEDLDYQRDRIKNVRRCMRYQSSSHSDVMEKADFVLDQMDQKLDEIEKNIKNLRSNYEDESSIVCINDSCLEIERTFKRLFAILSGKTTNASQERSGLNRIFTKFREEPFKAVIALFTSFSKQEGFSSRNGSGGSSSDNGRIDGMVRTAQSGRRVYGSLLEQCGTVDDSLNDLECRLHLKEGDDQLPENGIAQLLNELGECCLKISPVSQCMREAGLNVDDLKLMITGIKCNKYVPAGTLVSRTAEVLVRHPWGFKILSLLTKKRNCENLKKGVDGGIFPSEYILKGTKIVDNYKLRPLLDTFQGIVDQYPQYADSIIAIFKNLVEHKGNLKKIGNSLKEAASVFKQSPEENIDENLKKYLSSIAGGWEYDSDNEWDSDFDDEDDYYSDDSEESYSSCSSEKGKEKIPPTMVQSFPSTSGLVDTQAAASENRSSDDEATEFSSAGSVLLDGDSGSERQQETVDIQASPENENTDEELQEQEEATESPVVSELDSDSGSERQENLDSSSTQKSTGFFTRVKDRCSKIFNSFGRVLTRAGNQVARRLSSTFGSVSDVVSKGIGALSSPFKRLKFW